MDGLWCTSWNLRMSHLELTKSVTLLFTFVPHLSSTLKWHHRPTSKANSISPDTLVNPFSTKLQRSSGQQTHNAARNIIWSKKMFPEWGLEKLAKCPKCNWMCHNAWFEREDETWGQCVVKEIPCDFFLNVSYDDELLLSSDEWFIAAYLAACM